jgi:hypothetical protein
VVNIGLCESQCVFAQPEQAASKLQTASTALEQAFKAVLSAEKAGANVTDFLGQLNGALTLLTNAENAYLSGDVQTAIIDADAVLSIASHTITLAQTAEVAASRAHQNHFWITLTLTLVVSILFISFLFLVWRWFKRKYSSNLTTAKPEVT